MKINSLLFIDKVVWGGVIYYGMFIPNLYLLLSDECYEITI